MDTTVICVIAGIVFGLAVAFINSRITKAGMGSQDMTKVMATNMARLAIDAAALAAVFFICRAADLPVVPTLIAAALSLSIGGVLMIFIITRKAGKEDRNDKNS